MPDTYHLSVEKMAIIWAPGNLDCCGNFPSAFLPVFFRLSASLPVTNCSGLLDHLAAGELRRLGYVVVAAFGTVGHVFRGSCNI